MSSSPLGDVSDEHEFTERRIAALIEKREKDRASSQRRITSRDQQLNAADDKNDALVTELEYQCTALLIQPRIYDDGLHCRYKELGLANKTLV